MSIVPPEFAVPGTAMRTKILRAVAIAVLLALIGAFYLWTAGSNGAPLFCDKNLKFTARDGEIHPEHYGYYNLMADGFLAGRLSLLIEPPKEMLALADPYDPAQNGPFRLHDVSLYQGKYYLYFGPAPAILLFMPWRLLGIGVLSEPLAVALFAWGGLCFSVLLLRRILRAYLPTTPFWLQLTAIACLGLCNGTPCLLRRPVVYEVAISCGYFLMMAGLYLLVAGYEGRRWRRFALASLMFGLGIAARPTIVLSTLVMFAAWLFVLRTEYRWRIRSAWREALCLALPFLTCVFFAGLYNYLRFQSWTEFGLHYQLAGSDQRNMSFAHWDCLLPNLYFDLLCPAQITCEFPFFHVVFNMFDKRPGVVWPGYPAHCIGALVNIPITLMLFLAPVVVLREWKRRNRFAWILCSLVGLGVGMVLLFILIASASMRYLVEFMPLLLLPALLVWLYLGNQLQRVWTRAILNAVGVLLIVYGSVVNIAVGMTGEYNLLQAGQPATYAALERTFLPVSNVLALFLGPNKPTLMSYSNFGGVGRLPNGATVYWIGEDSFVLRVFCPAPVPITLQALWFPGPGRPENPQRTIQIQSNNQPGVTLSINQPQTAEARLVAEKGMNVITLRVAETPTVRLPEIGNRALMVGIAGLTLQFGSQ